MTPVPQGDITTSEILVPEVVPVEEAIKKLMLKKHESTSREEVEK
jgi:hypothetical protein